MTLPQPTLARSTARPTLPHLRTVRQRLPQLVKLGWADRVAGRRQQLRGAVAAWCGGWVATGSGVLPSNVQHSATSHQACSSTSQLRALKRSELPCQTACQQPTAAHLERRYVVGPALHRRLLAARQLQGGAVGQNAISRQRAAHGTWPPACPRGMLAFQVWAGRCSNSRSVQSLSLHGTRIHQTCHSPHLDGQVQRGLHRGPAKARNPQLCLPASGASRGQGLQLEGQRAAVARRNWAAQRQLHLWRFSAAQGLSGAEERCIGRGGVGGRGAEAHTTGQPVDEGGCVPAQHGMHSMHSTHLHAFDDLQRAVVHSAAQRDGALRAVHAVVQHQRQRGGGARDLGAVCCGGGGRCRPAVGGACWDGGAGEGRRLGTDRLGTAASSRGGPAMKRDNAGPNGSSRLPGCTAAPPPTHLPAGR